MPIKIDKGRADSYIGTFHYESADDMIQLQELKKMVSNMNKSLKRANFDYQFRVVVCGRLGENNPNAYKYKERKYSYHGYGAHPYQTIKLADASHVDAYIYRR